MMIHLYSFVVLFLQNCIETNAPTITTMQLITSSVCRKQCNKSMVRGRLPRAWIMSTLPETSLNFIEGLPRRRKRRMPRRRMPSRGPNFWVQRRLSGSRLHTSLKQTSRHMAFRPQKQITKKNKRTQKIRVYIYINIYIYYIYIYIIYIYIYTLYPQHSLSACACLRLTVFHVQDFPIKNSAARDELEKC